MHEMGMIANLIQDVEREIKKRGYTKVKTVWLSVGALAVTEPEAFEVCFEALAPDSILKGSKLEIVMEAGKGKCQKCGQEVEIKRYGDGCSLCGAKGLKIIGGDRVFIKQVEVEDD